MNEASGSEPFKVGQRYVEKSMVCLSHTLANSKIVKYNELESNIAENPYGVFISNIGSRNTPGDILISYRDSYTDERTVTKIEVKSGTSSSIFQFTMIVLNTIATKNISKKLMQISLERFKKTSLILSLLTN